MPEKYTNHGATAAFLSAIRLQHWSVVIHNKVSFLDFIFPSHVEHTASALLGIFFFFRFDVCLVHATYASCAYRSLCNCLYYIGVDGCKQEEKKQIVSNHEYPH